MDVLKDDHIFRMTDDTGMLQHSKYSLPDPKHGYTTDDNARALIMAIMLYERYKKKKYMDLIYRYSSFILNAQNEKGKFRNFMGYDRKWLEEEGSEDCFGRCLWALGFAVSNEHTPQGVKHSLLHILKNAMPHATSLNSPRAKAYSAIGLSYLEGEEARNLVFDLSRSLCRHYEESRDGEWKWFEDIVAYCNSVIPWSLIAAYQVTGEKKFLDVAEESLEFLGRVTFKDGYFKPVGCNGWLLKGERPAEFDEQPVEACESVLTYLEAYKATGKRKYLQKAKRCHEWYEGANTKGISLVDRETGGCFDGLTYDGVNLNKGAESLISYVISYLKISEANE
ncbi:glycosyltransferase [Pseudoclostridium thermosuccinogenes]|uniref:glycosyltransferase n=1 Tax=Clostridium thermosuccinogenes TaxID=84032 RepID=UPI000CCC7D35|nr:glycosyltransferase [Pseudoclostridium thermosuccinogenes]PNT92268.1 glycosyltransferase [Pseudoclostridium thermosuccinogenes]